MFKCLNQQLSGNVTDTRTQPFIHSLGLHWYIYLFRPGIVLFVRWIDQVIILLILRDEAHHPKIMQLNILFTSECIKDLEGVVIIFSPAGQSNRGCK